MKSVVKLGLILSTVDALVTVGLIAYVFRKSMWRFDNPEALASSLELITSSMTSILIQPVNTLWTKWLSEY